MYMKDSEARQLIKEYQDTNNETAFNKLFKAYEPVLITITQRHSYDKRDLFSEAQVSFLRAVRNYRVDSRSKFINYLYICVELDIRMFLRRYAAVFGNRSGDGDAGCLYIEDIDINDGTCSSEDLNSRHGLVFVRAELVNRLNHILNNDEFEVVCRFFGLDEYNEPVNTNYNGIREDAPRKVQGTWFVREVSDDLKLKRVSRQMKISRVVAEELYNSAINKIRDDNDAISLCEQYMQENGMLVQEEV